MSITITNPITFAGYACDVNIKHYANGRPAIQLVDQRDGMPVATASVNMPHSPCPENHAYIKDYAENAGIQDALVKAGIIRETEGLAIAGFELVSLCEILI